MSTITIIQVILFAGYAGYIWKRFGVLSSISASSYRLQGNVRYLFSGWLIALAITTFWQDMGVWGHLMAVGFVVAGMSLDHKQSPRLEDEFHTYGTVMAVAGGFGGLYFLHGIWIPAVAMAAGTFLFYLIRRNWIWWTEILAMGLIATGYVMR